MGPPFPYEEIDTSLVEPYEDTKLMRQIKAVDWIQGDCAYGLLAELCKRYDKLRNSEQKPAG